MNGISSVECSMGALPETCHPHSLEDDGREEDGKIMAKKKTHDQKRQARQRMDKMRRQSRELKPSEPDTAPDEVEMPSATDMEKTMRSLFGKGCGKNERAQDLAYEAMETADPIKSAELATQALKLDPNCVDAAMHLARLVCPDPEDMIKHMKMVVDIGVRGLGGPKYLEENRGYFWGILETRPYMRARAYLAQVLAEAGKDQEAIEHYEELLRLNPNDNQGLRYPLLGLYLMNDNLDGARRLFAEFKDEDGAVFAWGLVLERFLAGDLAGATKALKEARKTNPHAEKYLTGEKSVPEELPDFYGFGDENEAIICAEAVGPAWEKHPEARTFLRESK
jgi:tetratricopeptide (TPR) repeat protein